MKNISIIASALLLSSSILSADITIKSGWQLLGATQDMNTTIFDNTCIDYLWKYDATTPEWKIHIANGVNYTLSATEFSSFTKGEGYWVKGNGDCTINMPETTTSDNNNTLVFTTEYLNGKTLYGVLNWKETADAADNLIYAQLDFTYDSVKHIDSPDGNFTETYVISDTGNAIVNSETGINQPPSTPIFDWKITSITDDYIVVNKINHDSLEDRYDTFEEYFFFDKQKAENYLESVTPSTASTNVTIDNGDGTLTFNDVLYGTVTSPFTNRVWLDRNLGASQICTALDDTTCYGDYYQWGRGADGYQESNSTITASLATNINATNANGSFITSTSTPYDWTTADLNGKLRTASWSKTDGSSICPVGYRVPTTAELRVETINASTAVANNTDAFDNFLKLPSAGNRYYNNGSLNNQGSFCTVWSSSVAASRSQSMGFGSDAYIHNSYRASGFPVRCLRD